MKSFFKDLYRDLDDRHLLLPAIALAVALIAVPFVLSSETTPAVLPVSPSTESGGSSATQSAVLTENPGVRDYKRRLEQFKTKNPFEARVAPPPTAGTGGTAGSATGGVPGVDTGVPEPTSSGASVSGGSATSLPDTTASTGGGTSSSTSTSTNTTTTSSGSSTSSSGGSHTHTVFYTWVVDVNVGKVGDLEQRENVSRFSFLPGKTNPVFVFLGASTEGNKALFSLSSDATNPDGDGSCLPRASQCEYLILKKGESETVEYGTSKTRYKLALTEIDRRQVHAK